MQALFVFLPDINSIINIRIYCTVTVNIKLEAIELWLYTSTTDPTVE